MSARELETREPETGAWPRERGLYCSALLKSSGTRVCHHPGSNLVSSRLVSSILGGFTLIEMVVVVAIAVILLTLVLPAANTLLADRKATDAANTVQGLLMTSRARAVKSGGTETGVFFYLDEEGVQHMAAIEQVNPGDVVWENVFKFSDEPDQVLPKPFRLVPRYAIELPGPDPNLHYKTFEDSELSNEELYSPPQGNTAQRHRNFFTMVFSAEGQLTLWRDVLILDSDEDEDGLGDRTRLVVNDGTGDTIATNSGVPKVKAREYFDRITTMEVPIGSASMAQEIADLVTDHGVAQGVSKPVALNFPSVDGLLIYDDSIARSFSSSSGGLFRDYLIEKARPYYVSRRTGTIIAGPIGENQ